MTAPETLLSILESRMEELGITQSELGKRAFGKAVNTAIQSLKKGSSPAYDRVAAMADALGMELYLGPPRVKAPGFAESAEELSDRPQHRSTGSDYLPIPWHSPSIGGGSSPVMFSYAWMTANGLIPDDLAAIAVDHADMADLPGGKTLAVIDTRARSGKVFGIWCYNEGASTVMARLLFDQGSIIILSGKANSPPRMLMSTVAAGIRLLGKVVWIGLLPTPS